MIKFDLYIRLSKRLTLVIKWNDYSLIVIIIYCNKSYVDVALLRKIRVT